MIAFAAAGVFMLSVIIATDHSEQSLLPTLAALVAGATAGILREVIVADAGSRDDTATVADIAGCRFIVTPGPVGARLRAAAASARSPWLLFLRPGAVPDATWIDETTRFMRQAEPAGRNDVRAAIFRRAQHSSRSMLVEALALLAAALAARPHPEQGLLVSGRLYDELGGHLTESADPETDLLRRLGRRRLVMLRSGVAMVGT